MSIPHGVLSLQSVPGRMERIDRGQPFTVIVDYAHTEDALDSLLGGLRELGQGRLFVVFGCGGDRDRGKRPHMGRSAAERADASLPDLGQPAERGPAAHPRRGQTRDAPASTVARTAAP